MPTTKKRVNLTIPDPVYEQLQAYKEQNGIVNDASACLQLIVQQLRSQETVRAFMKIVQSSSIEQLKEMSDESLSLIKQLPAE